MLRYARDRLGYLGVLRATRFAQNNVRHPAAATLSQQHDRGDLVGALRVQLQMHNLSLTLFVEDLNTNPASECTTLTGRIPYER